MVRCCLVESSRLFLVEFYVLLFHCSLA